MSPLKLFSWSWFSKFRSLINPYSNKGPIIKNHLWLMVKSIISNTYSQSILFIKRGIEIRWAHHQNILCSQVQSICTDYLTAISSNMVEYFYHHNRSHRDTKSQRQDSKQGVPQIEPIEQVLPWYVCLILDY